VWTTQDSREFEGLCSAIMYKNRYDRATVLRGLSLKCLVFQLSCGTGCRSGVRDCVHRIVHAEGDVWVVGEERFSLDVRRRRDETVTIDAKLARSVAPIDALSAHNFLHYDCFK